MIDQSKNYHFLSTYWPSWRSLFLGQFLQAQTQLQAIWFIQNLVYKQALVLLRIDMLQIWEKAVHVCPQVCVWGYKQQI